MEHRREREEAIAENLLSLPQYRRAASLLLYIGRASEVGTALILRRALEQGKEVCVPYCPPGDGAMFFCRIDSTEELKPGRYGILEPDPKKSLDHTDWQTVLCLVPGIAFVLSGAGTAGTAPGTARSKGADSDHGGWKLCGFSTVPGKEGILWTITVEITGMCRKVRELLNSILTRISLRQVLYLCRSGREKPPLPMPNLP